VQAEREAAARRQAARSSIRIAVHEALAAGMTGEDCAHAFAEVLRERGLLATAEKVVTSGRSTRKK
jgi:hypothetical protein